MVSDYLPFVDTYGRGEPGVRTATALAALGEPMRQAIVQRLAAGPAAVGELAAALPVSRPAVSQHLKVLKEAGIVTVRQKGTRRVHHLDPAGLGDVRRWVESLWDAALPAFAEAAERAAAEEERT